MTTVVKENTEDEINSSMSLPFNGERFNDIIKEIIIPRKICIIRAIPGDNEKLDRNMKDDYILHGYYFMETKLD